MIPKIKQLMLKASKRYKISPIDLTPAQFWIVNHEVISEWQIRKLGGFTNLKNYMFNKQKTKEQSVVHKLIKGK